MPGDFDMANGDVRIRVEGLNKTIRALESSGIAAGEMRDLMHSIGLIVVRDAKSRVPQDSGKLARTIRAGRGKTKAVVRAGTNAVTYAKTIHYGSHNRNIAKHPFLKDALHAQRGTIFNTLDKGIADLLTKAGL